MPSKKPGHEVGRGSALVAFDGKALLPFLDFRALFLPYHVTIGNSVPILSFFPYHKQQSPIHIKNHLPLNYLLHLKILMLRCKKYHN